MKRTLTLFAALVLLAVGAAAQKLSYSAVVRNSANELVANQTLTVVVSIANSNGGPAVYSETHSGVQTNQNGLLTLVIGDGGSQAGSMSDVTWSTAYITSDYTMPDGAHVTNTVPVTAVPYALSAGNVEGGFEQVNADWNATSGAAQILNKPEIPVVNDGTLTIQKNGQEVGTFTANQAGNTTVNITITAQDILDAVSGMTPEQKSQLCQALNCGGEPGPSEPTTFTCGTSTVEDHQQNVYHTVQIGTQCWTRENMRCTTSPKGNLTMGSENSYDQPYYYNNTSTSANYNIPLEDRGMYYNWAGAMDTVFASTDNRNVSFEGRRGICPEGWHVPSDAEWTTLTEYVSNNHACNDNSEYNAKALAINNEGYWNRG
ncbi:MAG: fibrobacter succinogenes major paralogous domain-containing protein, partial [Bacteroidales bacterium]|nr:fibrobacter succinogenes major paralogous domain-containing protein [Bacteroidales bacterium]